MKQAIVYGLNDGEKVREANLRWFVHVQRGDGGIRWKDVKMLPGKRQ